jgi:hypothetical protein
MKNKSKTGWLVQWSFTPANYFEKPFTIHDELYELTVESGKAIATIAEQAGDPRLGLKEKLHQVLTARFAGAQLIYHQAFQLSKPSFSNVSLNGTTVYPETLEITMELSSEMDFVHKDKDGNILFDSKSERINNKQLIAELAGKYCETNLVVKGLLASYTAAVTDPSNELVHLYEIRESLSKEFVGKNAAIAALNITNKEWQELGRLANVAPLKQGRHRGNQISQLRDATKDELESARKYSSNMLISYLKYLDKKNGK